MTPELLKQCLPHASNLNINKFAGPLTDAMEVYRIDTTKRQAAFLAQVAHESGSLKYMKEIASGEAYDTGKLAASLGNTPEKDGDGQRYKGRGPFQITGFSNYNKLTHDIGIKRGVSFVKNPELLETPVYGCIAAGWFWNSRGLNELADVGNFEKITKRINGGLNGYADRVLHWERIKKVLILNK